MKGYCAYNFYRKFRHRRARRNSGGVVIYVKSELKNGVKIVKNIHDTIIWLKLEKSFFDQPEDFYICGAYIWGEDSPAFNLYNIDLFEVLEDDINYYSNYGKVAVCGDFNCRVGLKPDYIVCDSNVTGIDDIDYVPDIPLQRVSEDKTSNGQGIKLLDLCKATKLRIANGRIGDDRHTGAFTYSNVGSSVIDYLLLRECDFEIVKNFKVNDFNIFSDHTPLSIEFCCSKGFVNVNEDRDYEHYKWDCEKRDIFRRDLISQLPVLNNLTCSEENLNADNISSTIDSFVKVINNVAEPLFCKKGTYSNRSGFQNCTYKPKPWFDNDCKLEKNSYTEALRTFNTCISEVNREYLRCRKKIYKRTIRRKKRAYERINCKRIEALKHKKPRDFWRLFSKNRRGASEQIRLQDFFTHFQGLSLEINNVTNDEAEDFNTEHDFDKTDTVFEELDREITVEEVKAAINLLKQCKAPGRDNILNEYFLEAGDILCSHLVDLFNGVFHSGKFPDSWAEGIIVPVFKKGDDTLVENYRAITLVSCMSKLFTSILNKRLCTWAESYDKLSDAQFGFRKNKSTVDAVFILQNIVQHILNGNNRLFCAFVDLRKAFDSIYRNGLWLKLYKSGITGRMLRIVRSIYEQVKSCVKHCHTYSEFFEVYVGLRQGEVISPVLFSLYMEDLELYLQSNDLSGLTLQDITLILLLFADDMVIFGHDQYDLQNSLIMLCEYCKRWGLEVNTEKTKIMVFRKRGKVEQNILLFYDDQPLEIVDNFNYLGVVLNYTGSFILNQQNLSGKGLKAMNTLLSNIKTYDFTPKTLCQLFDSFVGSVISYSCEVWGFSKSKELERIHLRFCKRILGVKLSTSNAGIYGELGRYPLYITRYVRIVKFWFKLLNTENIILRTVYDISVLDCEKGYCNWVSNVKTLLEQFGFGYVWLNPYVDPKNFICAFKQRLIDNFIQKWKSDLENNRVLTLYNYFKTDFVYEEYLDKVGNKTLRQGITRIRLSSHTLRIQTGRYGRNRLDRAERLCLFCETGQIDDEYHFICECPISRDIRAKYIKAYYIVRPSVYKLCELLNTKSKKDLTNLSK
ncbi:MAG: reverse transcriptase family protein, partial [Candidatus Thiodiazotropha sp.]